MKAEGAKVLRRAVGGGLGGGGVTGRSVVENRRSLHLASELIVLQRRATALEDKNTKQAQINASFEKTNSENKRTLDEHGIKIEQLNGRVRDLCAASEGYTKLRHGFLSKFKQNTGMTLSDEDRQRIKEANDIAHRGGANVDDSSSSRRDD